MSTMKNLAKKAIRRLLLSPAPPAYVPAPASVRTELPLPGFNLSNAARFLYQQRLYAIAQQQDGDVVECGVGTGMTLLFWSYLVFQDAESRNVWGFDSFEGFPEPSKQDESPRHPKKGEWAQTDLISINRMLSTSGLGGEWVRANVMLVKGFFEDTLQKYTGDRIALLHIDADLYQSYKTTLEMLYDRVAVGGVIAFDEYMGSMEHYNFPGARQAVDEFFADKNQTIDRDAAFGKYYLIKR